MERLPNGGFVFRFGSQSGAGGMPPDVLQTLGQAFGGGGFRGAAGGGNIVLPASFEEIFARAMGGGGAMNADMMRAMQESLASASTRGRPTPESVQAAFPREPYRAGLEEGSGRSTCAVCLEDFTEGEVLTVLPKCGHRFHTDPDCLTPWLKDHDACPVCRARVYDVPTELPAGASEPAPPVVDADGVRAPTAATTDRLIGGDIPPAGGFFGGAPGMETGGGPAFANRQMMGLLRGMFPPEMLRRPRFESAATTASAADSMFDDAFDDAELQAAIAASLETAEPGETGSPPASPMAAPAIDSLEDVDLDALLADAVPSPVPPFTALHPARPEPDAGEDGVIHARVRRVDGQQFVRRFRSTDTVSDVLSAAMESAGDADPRPAFSVSLAAPGAVAYTADNMTTSLADAGWSGRIQLVLRPT